jgi:hypothetical protein
MARKEKGRRREGEREIVWADGRTREEGARTLFEFFFSEFWSFSEVFFP